MPSYRQAGDEGGQIARSFIAKHSLAIGNIDLDKLTLETGEKDSGNGRVN